VGSSQVKAGVAVNYLEGVSRELLLVEQTGVIDTASRTVQTPVLVLVGGQILVNGAHYVKLPHVLEGLADRLIFILA
jgi:hypothetical protein